MAKRIGGRRKQYENKLSITLVCDWYWYIYKHTHSYFFECKKNGGGRRSQGRIHFVVLHCVILKPHHSD